MSTFQLQLMLIYCHSIISYYFPFLAINVNGQSAQINRLRHKKSLGSINPRLFNQKDKRKRLTRQNRLCALYAVKPEKKRLKSACSALPYISGRSDDAVHADSSLSGLLSIAPATALTLPRHAVLPFHRHCPIYSLSSLMLSAVNRFVASQALPLKV